MSQAPSMPLFCGDYIADTKHLTLEQHGAYLMMMMVTWRNGAIGLPDDDERLARTLGITAARWAKTIRPALVEFFDVSDGTWRQKRLEKEWAFVQKRAAISRENGPKGGRPKSLKTNDTENPAGYFQETQNEPTQPQPQEEEDSDPNGSLFPRPKPRVVAMAMVAIWHEELRGFCPDIKKLTPKRILHLNARLHDTFDNDTGKWREFCRGIRGSPFMGGENNRGWKADIDFVTNPEKIVSILEGKYDYRTPRNIGPSMPNGALSPEDRDAATRRAVSRIMEANGAGGAGPAGG